MQDVTLGRTGLRCSVAGLGCGGHSRLGLNRGGGEADAERIVRTALDVGINFIDTAEAYRTEAIVGRAIRDVKRDSLTISTKKSTRADPPTTADEVAASLEASLRALGTDYIDIYHLHGVSIDGYERLATDIVPVLQRCKAQGKVRHLGITEAFASDPGHATLQRALQDDWVEVLMVGLNMLNFSASERVLPQAQAKGVGTLIMFAVRKALSQPVELRRIVGELIARTRIDADAVTLDDPLGFVASDGALPDAAYRFCRHTPGADVILTGTGDADHLRRNVASINGPPLDRHIVERLYSIFAGVDDVSGQ
jgi:aryl-alcohol dehydrogenase-like predicted oxidoreductase